MRALLVGACFVLCASGASAQNARPSECHVRHYAAYATAQRAYQRAVERMVIAADSSLHALAELARTEQVARIDARQRAVESLLSSSPASVRVGKPVNQWLDWGPAEAEQLSRTDSVYARLDASARAARAKIAGHPDWPKVQRIVRERMLTDPQHREALERLAAAMRAPLNCGVGP